MNTEFNLSCPICKGNSDKCDCEIPEEFNLSEKIIPTQLDNDLIDVRDVKEFLRLLKDITVIDFMGEEEFDRKGYDEEIDKLAGEKLLEKVEV